MPTDPPFAELIRRLKNGDPDMASLIFDRYVRQLIGVAAGHLPDVLARKLDPEDVVQSVFHSFFTRHRDGRFLLEDWDHLWRLLAMLTVRKCGKHVDHFLAARRDVRREKLFAATEPDDMTTPEAVTPSPLEAILLAETLAIVLGRLPPTPKLIVQLRLEGYTIVEISQKIPCTERTVYRVLEKVRRGLEPRLTEKAAC
jgi:RNA polymerase sigma-70 factor (ECF subfamily)